MDVGAFDTSSDEDDGLSSSSSEDEVQVASRSRRRKGSERAPKGRVAVQQLDGSKKFVRASAATAAVTPLNDDGWREVEIQYYLCASLNELAEGDKDPVLKLSDKALAFGEKEGAARTVHHICGGMSVTEYDSTFPATLQLDVDGIQTDPPVKRMTHEGSCGALTIRPKSTFSDPQGLQIASGNSQVADNSTFLKTYAGWNPDNVDNGITYAEDDDGEEQAFVKSGHPVISYFNEARRDAGEGALTDDDLLEGTKLYMASAGDTRKCLAALKKAMSSRLQIQDLYKVQFKLRRARGAIVGDSNQPEWNDATEVGDALSDKSREVALNQPNKRYLTVKYKYKNLG